VPRPRYPSVKEPLPPPLPPAERTVGQLVAEAIRLYGQRFWPAVLLGLPVAVADQLELDRSVAARIAILCAFAPVFTLAYAAACTLVSGSDARPEPRAWLTALAAGTLVFLPAAALFPWFALAAVLWLGLGSQVVPAAMLERRSLGCSLRRGLELARADYVHAAGSLATLAILFGLTRLVLGFVLRAQADNTVRSAIFLADVALAPMLFLGAALLYFDQAARVGSGSRRRRRRNAALPDADDADREGRPDAQVEPRPPA
jgi:hypothetical protein